MSVESIVQQRGIKEVVHFTMSKGLLGILATGEVLSRQRITDHEILEFIARMNADRVLDPRFKDYVNLSVSEVNHRFFTTSSTKWHPNDKWAVLGFDPAILAHDGVIFVTTNNAYPSCERAKGDGGIKAVFEPKVSGLYGNQVTRVTGMPDHLTTDEQAEVLYPRRLSIDYLRKIYVRDGDFQDQVHAHLGAVAPALDVEVIVAPERFLYRGGRVL
jgi:hypothetical protein